MSPYRFVAILCIAPVALAGAPRAAYADDAATRSAKKLYERALKLYNLSKFADALDLFQQAYDAKPIPAFLFNIGQCHRGLGDYDKAIFSYKKYLQLQPDADNRDKVEQLISDLEDKQAKEVAHQMDMDRPPRPPPTKPDPPVDQPPVVVVEHHDAPVYKRWWFWTGVAVVGVAAGVGIYAASRGGTPGTDLGNIAVPPP
jgi:tetratricopeptide (TPR) repeat protein